MVRGLPSLDEGWKKGLKEGLSKRAAEEAGASMISLNFTKEGLRRGFSIELIEGSLRGT